ncbi:MAG: sigma-70 family RNA polymerase sigma factor [Acidobacteria bacterium]|nr:sigma-70 family RNA polymerase sigma factor [Acidobacteriota bacterium]
MREPKEAEPSSGGAGSTSDPNLARRIQAREPEAIRAVVHAYLDQIFRAACGAGLDPQRAEEVTQATFTTFVEKAEAFEGRSHVRTWLFGILYRKIAEARRELQRETLLDDIEETVERRFNPDGTWMRPPRTLEAEVYRTEIKRLIEECLNAVPLQQRMAFILRESEDLPTEEICKILDVTPTNLGVLLFRVRNRLRECLETKGVKGSSDAQL